MEAWRVQGQDALNRVLWEKFAADEATADDLADRYLEAGAERVTFKWTDVPTRYGILGTLSFKHDSHGQLIRDHLTDWYGVAPKQA